MTGRNAKALILALAAAAVVAGGCVGRPEIVQDRAPPDFQPRPAASVLAPLVPSPGGDLSTAGRGAWAPRRMRVGNSVEGRALAVEVFGAGAATTLVLGGIHGDEPAGVDAARRLAAFLGQNPQAARGRTVAILADVNPDGAVRRTRGNANGVDLNRNFPASNWQAGVMGRTNNGGTAAASEPETQAVLRLIERLRPDRILSIHSTSGSRPCNNYDGPGATLARLMAARNGYPVVASIGHPTPGSLGNWAGVDRGIPVLTLELPEGRADGEVWEQNRQALVEAISADGATPAGP